MQRSLGPVLRLVRLLRARWAFLGHGVALGSRPSCVGRRPFVRNKGTLRIGSHLTVRGNQFRTGLTTDPGATLVIGDRVLLNQGVTVHASTSVEIGDGVKVADLAAIYDTDFHEVEPGAGVRSAPVRIGTNAWIGRGALVLPGVTIGADAVVAAGSVVTSDVPDGALVAGVPARVVKQLGRQEGYRRG